MHVGDMTHSDVRHDSYIWVSSLKAHVNFDVIEDGEGNHEGYRALNPIHA